MTGNQLIALRKKAGLGPVELARRLGVSYPTLFRWERGDVPISEPMAKLIRLTLA